MFARNSSLTRRASSRARLLRRRGHLVRHHAEQRPRLRADRAGALEVEGDGAEHALTRLEGQRDDRAESKLVRHLGPVLERGVGHHVGHLDHAPLRRRLAAGPEAEPHPHLAKEGGEALRPVVDRGEAHQLTGAVDEVDAGEGRADERTHPIERELEHLLRPVGGEEGVHDLADSDQLAHAGLCALRRRAQPLAGERGRWGHARNMGLQPVGGQTFTSRGQSR
jgi:hypothetical protein